jgi:hypothetical protein
MSSLFNISQDFKSLYILANDAENEDMEALAELFSEVETSLSDKLDNTIYVIKELDSDAEALKAEAKRLTDKARALENKGKYLKELMLGAVKASGVEKLKSDKFSYYIKRTEVLNVVSEDNIGREFFRIKKEIDKTVLKKAIKDGLIVDGVSIVENESLVSR